MTPKERVRRILKHEDADIVPYHLSFTIPSAQKLAEHLGENFLDEIGNHCAIMEAQPPYTWEEIRPDVWRDEFGVVWNRTIDKDIGTVEGTVLPTPTLEGYTFPDPDRPGRFDEYPAFVESNRDRFVFGGIGFSLFERAWTMRGMANLLEDMLLRPSFVEELLDAILEYNLGVIRRILEFDVDGVRFGDDWGHQRGVMMGPHLWRRFIKPRVAQMYGTVKDAGRAVMIHSCGAVEELFPDLIEIGLDIFNPFQPEEMDVYAVKQKYGADLTFFGGVSTQRTLPYGTPADVKAEVRRLMREVGQGGGYVLAPAHDIPRDASLDNLLALIETVQDQ